MEIIKAKETGFCFGVRRAIDILVKAVRQHGKIETLGAVVHNDQVLERLSKIGVTVAHNLNDIKGQVIAISSHGVTPETESEIQARHLEVIDTTCPFVRRAQIAARRLVRSDFFVVIFGDAKHPEVRGILGWAQNQGVASLEADDLANEVKLRRRLGVLSQTTQVPEKFTRFTQEMVTSTLGQDSEIRIIDTICHDIRKRQAASLELARVVDLVLVVGGRYSANTQRLSEICSAITETHHIEKAQDMDLSWFNDRARIGVTIGASTADHEINAVIERLETLDKQRK